MQKNETHIHYRWPASTSGLIDHVEVIHQKNGRAVAYLHAQENQLTHDKQRKILTSLQSKGWGTLADFRDGKPVLRVSGLRDEGELIALMKTEYTQGEPERSIAQAATPSSVTEPEGIWQNIRSNSLKWSGILASVGNAMSIASGIHRSMDAKKDIDWGQIGKGTAFAVADLPLALAGGHDDARQRNDLLLRLKNHYQQHGIEISQNSCIHTETSDAGKSLRERSQDLMHRYANQIKCSFEVVAAGMSIWAGKKQRSEFKRLSPYFWGSGFLATLLIPEKKIDEEKYAQAGTLERFWMKIQSNPLKVGGLLGYTNNIGDYLSAYSERREWKAAGGKGTPLYRWDAAIPTVMLGANGLYAISSKTTGGDIRNAAMESDIYAITAQTLNTLPEGKREAALESTIQFLADCTELRDDKYEVRERLVATMVKQRENPWFKASTTQLTTSQTPASVSQTSPATQVSGSISHVGKDIAPANDVQLTLATNAR